MDERQRELERQASAGDVEAEAKLLLERVRSGDLTEERLRLAAYLDDPASRTAIALLAGQAPESQPDFRSWIDGFVPWQAQICTRVAIAAALTVLPEWERRSANPTPRLALAAALEWVLLPEERNAELAVAAAHDVIGAFEESGRDGRPTQACLSAQFAARAPSQEDGFVSAVIFAVDASRARPDFTKEAAQVRVREAICDMLVPWALGYGDPVRDRVDARKREASE